MIYLWLLLMGLFVAWLAVPVTRQMGYNYGRFGTTGDMLVVLGGVLFGGVVLALLLGAIGQTVGDVGVLVLGLGGALLAVVVLTLFSASAAASEPNHLRETPPGHPIDDTDTVRPTARPHEDYESNRENA